MTPKIISRVNRESSEEEKVQMEAQRQRTADEIVAQFTKKVTTAEEMPLGNTSVFEQNVDGGELLTLEQVKEELVKLDRQAIINEVFTWVAKNVASFIDTRRDDFHLQFDPDETTPELMKLKNIWQSATSKDTVEVSAKELMALEDKEASLADLLENPAVVREAKKFEVLEAFCDEILTLMTEDRAGRDKIFEAVSQYYKLSGMLRNKETGEVTPVEREVDGYVMINYFCFENYDLDVAITPMDPVVDPETGQVTGFERKRDETTVIESNAAFCMDIQVVVRDTEQTGFSLF